MLWHIYIRRKKINTTKKTIQKYTKIHTKKYIQNYKKIQKKYKNIQKYTRKYKKIHTQKTHTQAQKEKEMTLMWTKIYNDNTT